MIRKMKKKEITLIKTINQKYCTNELEPHDYCIEIFYHWTVKRYKWEIYYSNDQEKWGSKQYNRAADSYPKYYKTPKECIPDIEEKILSVFGEHVIIALSEDQSIFKKERSEIKEVRLNKNSDSHPDTFWNYEDTDFHIRIYYNLGANAYVWEICYSENRSRWGGKCNNLAAHSWPKRYKTPQECIPDIEHHVRILSWGKAVKKI